MNKKKYKFLKEGCFNLNMEYINNLCTRILVEDFNQEEKVRVKLNKKES